MTITLDEATEKDVAERKKMPHDLLPECIENFTEIKTILKDNTDTLKRIEGTLHGNGSAGLKTRVSILESEKKSLRMIILFIIALGGFGMGLYSFVTKM